MERRKPHYDIDDVKGCVTRGDFRLSKRVAGTLRNHGYADASSVAAGVFESISADDFLKCDELRNLPGVMADIYSGTVWDGAEWYVKFFRREDGSTVVDVWSLKEDGWM